MKKIIIKTVLVAFMFGILFSGLSFAASDNATPVNPGTTAPAAPVVSKPYVPKTGNGNAQYKQIKDINPRQIKTKDPIVTPLPQPKPQQKPPFASTQQK